MEETPGHGGSGRSRERNRFPGAAPCWIVIVSFTSLAIVVSCLVCLIIYSNDNGVALTIPAADPTPSTAPSPPSRVSRRSFIRLRGGENVRASMSSHADGHIRGTDDNGNERDDYPASASRVDQKMGDPRPRHFNIIRRREVAPAEAEAWNDEETGAGRKKTGIDDDDSSRLHSHPEGDHNGKGKSRHDNHRHRNRLGTYARFLANTTTWPNVTNTAATNTSIGDAGLDDGEEKNTFDEFHVAPDHQHKRGADDLLMANTTSRSDVLMANTSSNATMSTTNGSNTGADESYNDEAEEEEEDTFDDYHVAPTQFGDDDGGTTKRSSWASNRTQPSPVQLVPEARIIGGSEIENENRHPYLVAIFRQLPKNQIQHVCGGTLIAPNVVLSAAHCYSKFKASVVRIGETDLRSSDEDRSMEEFDIVESIVHPDYDNVRKDFVLFVLDGTSRYAPISLNEGSNRPRVGRNLYVMGWGRTSTGRKSSPSPVAREVVVQAVSNDDCDDMYGRRLRVTDDMLCASSPGRDACDGDSGGPAIIRGDNPGEDLLVGVVSQGIECANPKYPGVYARVSSVVDWIWGWLDAIEANGGDDDGDDPYNGDDGGSNSPRESDGDGGGHADAGQDATEDGEGTDPTDAKKNENDNEQGRRSEVEKTETDGDCEDVQESFRVSGKSKKRDCSWVGKDMGKRCDDFSELCPMTCGRCGDR